jgi:hypothetical protein
VTPWFFEEKAALTQRRRARGETSEMSIRSRKNRAGASTLPFDKLKPAPPGCSNVELTPFGMLWE